MVHVKLLLWFLGRAIFQGIGAYLLKGKLEIFIRGIIRVGQWVLLHPSSMKNVQFHLSILLKQGIKDNLHPLIKTTDSFSDILHLSIDIPNDALVCNKYGANYCLILKI